MRKWIAAGMVMAAMALAACGETVQPEKVEPGQSQQASGEASGGGGGQAQVQTFKVGDTIKLGNIQYTVHGIREVKGDNIFKPEEGNKWVAVEVTVENVSDEPHAVSSLLGFTLQDSDGYAYNVTILPVQLKGSLDGEIAPGRKIRGEVAFDIPKDAKGLELVIDANVFGMGQAIVDLGQ